MKPDSNGFLELWHARRIASGEAIPAWRNFKASELGPFAESLSVIEIMDEGGIRFRMAGTLVERLTGSLARNGQPFQWLNEDEAKLVIPIRRRAFDVPCGYSSHRQFHVGGGQEIDVSVSVLPATGVDGRLSILLAFMEGHEPVIAARIPPKQYLLKTLRFIDLGYGTAGPDIVINRDFPINHPGAKFLDE